MKLGDVCTKIGSGATPKGGKGAYSSSGMPIIRSQNIWDWAFNPTGLAFLSESQAEALTYAEVRPGDVLLNITGDSVARACMAPVHYLPARVNQHVAILRPSDELFPIFLLSYLQLIKPELLKLASSGATRNALTKGMLEKLDIPVPPLETQHAIASIVNAIQTKIALNTKINNYLAA